jgi:hypothetical protein
MKTISTKVFKVNGRFNIYASEETREKQSYAALAAEMGRDWNSISKCGRANFKKRHAEKLKFLPTLIEVYGVTATIPNIFGETQLKEAAIQHLIFQTSTLFLRCRNGVSGYETTNFIIKKEELIRHDSENITQKKQ